MHINAMDGRGSGGYAGRVRAQPPGHEGTPERPYSSLNLRLAMAGFGLLVSAVLAVPTFRAGHAALGWALVLLALVAAVDLVVIQLRRRARRRTGRDERPR